MYFWRDKKLAESLRDVQVTQKQQMLYLLTLGLFCGLFMTMTVGHAMWSDIPSITLYDQLADISFLAVIIFTVLYTYKLNGGSEGVDFITRYTCLSLPITIKSTILVFFLIIIALILDNPEMFKEDFLSQQTETEISTISYDDEPVTGVFFLGAMIIAQIYVIWRYIICFKIIRQNEEGTQT